MIPAEPGSPSAAKERAPGVAFCKGGAATCETCVGSCGIEEWEAAVAADRLPDPDGWVKLPCNCYAEWTGDEWRIAASSFTCDHKQGDHCDGAPPVSAAVSPAEPPEDEKEDVMPANDEARDALVEAMFKAGYSDPNSDGVDREWMRRGQYENGYRAEVVLGLLRDAGFDVVKVDV